MSSPLRRRVHRRSSPRRGARAQARASCEDRARCPSRPPRSRTRPTSPSTRCSAAQRPKTDEHDELLFIVIHQVYELWFKQLLHELVHLQRRLEAGEGPRALATVRRILTILKTVVAQIDVLETMTPSQFATFRARLDAASGFQSAQFRELEAVLGRRDDGALDAYEPGSAEHERIAEAMRRRSLFDSFLRYLHERRPRRPARRPRARRDAGRPSRRRASSARSSRPTAATARRRRSPSAWSTSTRASRSGATAT